MLNKRNAGTGDVADLEACQVETKQGIGESFLERDSRGRWVYNKHRVGKDGDGESGLVWKGNLEQNEDEQKGEKKARFPF